MKKILFITAALMSFGQISLAANSCSELFSYARSQQDLIQSLVENKVSFYVIQGRENKKIPVILANAQTIDLIKPLLDESVGFEVMSKAGWPNDHGSFRYGQYIIDAYMAGQRQVGEIHETGLSWKTAKDSAIFLDKIADIIGEAVFPVTKAEMRIVDFYQRVRRAAFYRIPFRMGDQAIYNKFDNVLTECGGYCFEFSQSTTLTQTHAALLNRIEIMDPASTIRKKFQTEIDNYILKVQTNLENANIYDAQKMSEKILITEDLLPIISKFIPIEWPQRQSQLFLNYIVSAKAVLDMNELINTFNLYGNNPVEMVNSARAQALIVWDPEATQESFNGATYQKRAQTFAIPQGSRP